MPILADGLEGRHPCPLNRAGLVMSSHYRPNNEMLLSYLLKCPESPANSANGSRGGSSLLKAASPEQRIAIERRSSDAIFDYRNPHQSLFREVDAPGNPRGTSNMRLHPPHPRWHKQPNKAVQTHFELTGSEENQSA
ncbi:hypothetical protein FGG08_002253 [Glutinoglossum americanum]|uniref:Uncharacterized protein n=1 Tax=Glutinoglossum americanum TaxID=1670608 RepID=A0A9P8I9I6_9PEZI|nr:hypothetical protein FGG08_002253 [Glutinoglossum americanum]